MKIIALSDTHGLHKNAIVPDGDILIHAGDFCNWGVKDEVKSFNKWLGTLPHKHKIVIAGNHDICLDPNCRDPRTGNHKYDGHQLITNAHYLENESIEIEGIKFWGSPFTPMFMDWAFMMNDPSLEGVWAKIPEDTEVLITHGPAYGILDEVFRASRETGDCVGSTSLLKRIQKLKNLKYHLFGHIHGSYGTKKSNLDEISEKNPTGECIHINASICTEAYEPVNAPIVIEI